MSNFGLPQHYRFQVHNGAQASVTWQLRARRSRMTSTGGINYATSVSTLATTGTVATDAYDTSDTQDNSTDQWLGGAFEIKVSATQGSPTGDISVYFQPSVDGSQWPSNGGGFVIASVPISGTATEYETFEL